VRLLIDRRYDIASLAAYAKPVSTDKSQESRKAQTRAKITIQDPPKRSSIRAVIKRRVFLVLILPTQSPVRGHAPMILE
jgi:hypothetical protein